MSDQDVKTNWTQFTATSNLLAGGVAGIMEACICHPLDTVKVRMQLLRKEPGFSVPTDPHHQQLLHGLRVIQRTEHGFFGTLSRIIRTEGLFALYRGFDAVVIGMGPKMAVRFTSFEAYKTVFQKLTGQMNGPAIFSAGLAAGVTEAVFVVNPMEVVKIRLQGQRFTPDIGDTASLIGYRNALHAAGSIAWKEGIGTLYQGVVLTALRQGTNQAANFTAYTMLKAELARRRPHHKDLPSYQTAGIGLLSGAIGPICNAPIDTVKTRLQNCTRAPGESGIHRCFGIVVDLLRNEGIRAFYKGLTPRVIRVAPGQAVTFTVYEFVKGKLLG